ncbi:hypothetical protein ACTI_17240 [Actinoplanes sp. OR16]|uniref:hypothetical protein n=1 Tax=Actinoplanes sp. OR16 TaxID=946334 RepID=UPI000F70BF77|nr:hypothetical protein [Actinoplanes sp. OR16]BBH65039.1 hypothetical protein ACTI_17240 [Actinoplanes sp. OR16]
MRVVLVAALVAVTLAGCTDGGEETATPVPSAPSPGTSMDMPPSAFSSPKPLRSEPGGPSAAPGLSLALSASAYGPYRVGQSQAELEEAKMVRGLKPDEAGCVSGTGSRLMQNPRLRFSGGRLVMIELTNLGASTDTGLLIGAELDEVKAKYPTGKIIFGTAGAAWETVDGDNALLVRITGDDVTGLVGGVATSVEARHRAGLGC